MYLDLVYISFVHEHTLVQTEQHLYSLKYITIHVYVVSKGLYYRCACIYSIKRKH